ncbi:DNA primase [Streptomyces sp. NPDC057197]|uniref:DNA primase n=1 Tax=Streptomyces sp. NPDC057197 TaxID=3346045 RepID=UPI00363A0741
MNRVGLGLAVGAGYLLGRTKKAKLAFAVGSLVAGKKLNLGPRALADLLNQQLKDNPQFKEIGDQLRQDLRGVGKAASGAMVERQMTALADRLHGRTAQVRDELAGAVPDGGSGDGAEDGRQDGDGGYDDGDGGDDDYEDRGEGREVDEDQGQDAREESRGKAPAKKSPADPAKKAARKAPAAEPAEKAAKKAPARKAAAKKTAPARKAAAKKTAAAGRASGAARSRSAKGGGER